MNLENVKNRLRVCEGCLDFMYLCTGQEVTVGVGHALQTSAVAVQLPWRAGGLAASEAQIKADFHAVRKAQQGMVASKYAPLTKCRLSTEEIDRLLQDDIAKFEAGLRERIPNWGELPEPAQEALFDMAFNLGIAGLFRKFPKMMTAVKAGDWKTAAAQCERGGISPARNKETAELFRKSAEEAA